MNKPRRKDQEPLARVLLGRDRFVVSDNEWPSGGLGNQTPGVATETGLKEFLRSWLADWEIDWRSRIEEK